MNFHLSSSFCLVSFQLVAWLYQATSWGPVDPTRGFVSLPFNGSYYEIQKPWDVPENQRYRFRDGVHKLWVFATDKPRTPDIPTKPRTEIAIHGYNYSSGVWQFEGDAYVPYGTSGVCIMQVFGATPPHASTFMLRVYNGTLTYYSSYALVPNVYDKWFRVNVVHDVDASKVKVYIDGCLKLEAQGRGGTLHAFKCGVYAQEHDSYYMESRWKNIKILKKCGS
ncbi:hypothetical protein C2S52_021281 [Perilla frutescens var. hirtella]|nr:hypothetical protein C2S52_021281 [Perilla frutescens var. hirtella]